MDHFGFGNSVQSPLEKIAACGSSYVGLRSFAFLSGNRRFKLLKNGLQCVMP
jgi:hypothetical protein